MTQAPESKTSPGTVAVFFVVLGLALCCGAPAVLAYRWWDDPKTKDAIRASATSYLDALVAGDHDAAYRGLCTHEQGKNSLAEWSRSLNGSPTITAYRIIEVQIIRRADQPTRYSVDVEVTYGSGQTYRKGVSATHEGGGWRMCPHTAPL
ncbi:MAG: hypothetical protein HOV79_10950 [Hamadaea sp.]|nr:hypothetical protein [Hamadaea sp.]